MPPQRPAFLEAADLPEPTLLQRLARLQFRREKAHTPAQNVMRAQSAEDESHIFQPTEAGSGVFGRWILDDAGLPAYEYTLNQYTDDRAKYPTSDERDHRDHWHQVGNHRITALASNDGTVQVYVGDRGGTFLNRFEAHTSPSTQSPIVVFLAGIGLRLLQIFVWLVRPRQPYTAAPQDAPVDEAPRPRGEPGTQYAQADAQSATVSAQSVSGDTLASSLSNRAAQTTSHAYAGGFGYIDDGGEVWSTAYRYRPLTAVPKRIFGMGYAENELTYRNLKVTRKVYAPFGDVPALLADVTIENQGTTDAKISYYEYWDVNPHQLRVQWVRSGVFGTDGDMERARINRNFSPASAYLTDSGRLVCRQSLVNPAPGDSRPPDDASPIDWQPESIFLADLSGTPDAVHLNKAAFFGTGGVLHPTAISAHQPDKPVASGLFTPFCLVIRRDLTIPANGSRSLRFAYGIGEPDLSAYRIGNPLADTKAAWKKTLAYFWTGQDPELQREMAWHAYNLLSATVYSRYHQVHLVPQGSAYLFLHGADGVPRDQALFSLPMTYLEPGLAKDMLRLIMRLTDAHTGQMTYSFVGNGDISNALNVHTNPSDLDLFFLLALAEYLSATGDYAFLDEKVPYYPRGVVPDASVLDHVRFALHHLFNTVKVGEHNLLHVCSGDWSDGIVLGTAQAAGLEGLGVYLNSKEHGESVPNTQMALYVLPMIATILKDHAPDVVALINDGRLDILRAGVEKQWNVGGYYNRAVLRNARNEVWVIDRLDLEAQPWALISDAAKNQGVEADLINRVDSALDTPSPIGAAMTVGGAVWPAISQLMTWAYARTGRGDLAWRSLNRNSFASHAAAYPKVWYGIWSGPDGINGLGVNNDEKYPGYTWESTLTPMRDFPAMNANPHAMALLGLLRVCGVEPAPEGDGLVIRPRLPRERFTLDLPLLHLEVELGHIRGVYHAKNAGQIRLYLYPPGAAQPTIVPLAFNPGDNLLFEASFPS